MLIQFNEIRFTYAHFSDAIIRIMAHLWSAIFHIFRPRSAFNDGTRNFQIFRVQKKKLDCFRAFLFVFYYLECGDNRMALRLKKPGWKPFFNGCPIPCSGKFFFIFFGFSMLSLVQKCPGNLLGTGFFRGNLDEL